MLLDRENGERYCRYCKYLFFSYAPMILSFRTDRSGQTVQTQIRLLLEEQSDQGFAIPAASFGCITLW